MKNTLLILGIAATLFNCTAEPIEKSEFCGNVVWAEYDIKNDAADVTLFNGNETKKIKVYPARQFEKNEYTCLKY